jgi:hypothetical protein
MCKRLLVTFVGVLFLTGSIPAFAQEVLYTEDFEAGVAESWDLEPGWRVEQDERNFVLSGEGHSWARIERGQDWTNYSFRLRLKLIRGGIHLNYRVSEKGRYFIGFLEDGLYLNKETPWGKFFELARSDARIGINTWHDIEIRGEAGHLQVYVDGMLEIDFTDDAPITQGSIAFETLKESHAYVDNVEANVRQDKPEITVRAEGSYNRAATILMPLYMYYLERYFSDVSDKTDLDLYIRSVLDESTAGREMLGRALANYKAIPLETLYEIYDAEVISMTVEGDKPINLADIKEYLADASPVLGLDLGGAPTAPSNLIAKNTSARDEEFPKYEITLTWQSNSNNEDGFRIYRVFKPAIAATQKLVLIATVGPNVTTYRDLLTKPANKKDLYCYEVRAYRDSPVALVGQTPPVYESGPSNSTCESYSTSPPPKPSDMDGDGVPDFIDECPSQKGALTHGCPDKDSDGIPNKDDFCPSLAGLPSGKYVPKNRHGCPQRYNLRWMGMKIMNNSAAYAFSGYKILPDKKLYDNEKHNDNNYGGGEEPYLVFTWNNGLTSKGMLEQGSSRWCCGEGVDIKKGDNYEPDKISFGEEHPLLLNSIRNTGLAIWPSVAGLSAEIDTKLGLGVSTTLMERDYDVTITVEDEADAIEAALKTSTKVVATVASCAGSGGLGCLISIGSTIKEIIYDIVNLSKPSKTITVNDPDDFQGMDFWAITASDAASRTAANGAYPFYLWEMPTDVGWFCTWIPCNVGQGFPRYMRIKPYYCLCREGMSDSEIKQHCAPSNANVVLPWPMKAP